MSGPERELGAGRRLEPAVRARMEPLVQASLDGVRVHEGAKAASVAKQLDAHAFAVGEHIGFGGGRYRPGTPIGDALIAHELAHVAQEQQGRGRANAESEADQVALRSLAQSSPVLARRAAAMITARPEREGARSSVSGLRLRACSRGQQVEPPSYLGPESGRTFRNIQRIIESLEDARVAIALGTTLAAVASPPNPLSPPPLEEAVTALAGIDPIMRNRILLQVDLLMVEHGNTLTPQETAYWQTVRATVAAANDRARAAGARQ